jgi:hypothetical protein
VQWQGGAGREVELEFGSALPLVWQAVGGSIVGCEVVVGDVGLVVCAGLCLCLFADTCIL